MVTLKQTRDLKQIKAIITDPEMFERITDDGVELADFDVSVIHAVYLLCVNELDEVVGFFLIQPRTQSSVDVHIHVIKKHRPKHALECGNAIIEWLALYAPEQIVKMTAEVPASMTDVYRFAEKLGFVREGINRASVMKGGVLVDQIYYGMTKEEAKQILLKGVL